ncbi:MAG TPA: glucokinase [Desulfobacterales bacterium]
MKTILAADIGGTHSRFGAFRGRSGRPLERIDSLWLPTAEADSFESLLKTFEVRNFVVGFEQADIVVFAVAGPVVAQTRVSPPNIDWEVDLADIESRFGVHRAALINDFAAQAYACRTLAVKNARKIADGPIDDSAPLAVIGAGTGLGQSALIPTQDGKYIALATEGGHIGFAFEHEEELDYMRYLLAETGEPYVRAESVVSGGGLSRLHHFLTGRKLQPAQVSQEIDDHSPTMRWMARFYGRVCRNLALQVLAFGGVYIAGGVAAKIPGLVMHSEFLRSFRHSHTMAAVLGKIPVLLNTNEESGLWGAALKGLLELQ